jgi:monolysocardiolipin acyltransferase
MGREGNQGRALTAAERAAIDRWRPEGSLKNRTVASVVAKLSRLLMQGLNQVVMHNPEAFRKARSGGRGLLSFSNHVSLFDDPLLTACISETQWASLRWIAADAMNFFGSWSKAAVFNGGKCVPIVRGAGVTQPGMTFLAEKLAEGDWVHVFPEGGRTRHVGGRLQLPFKRGMAELITSARPLVVPFHHSGMEQVLPIGHRLPSINKRVELRFGQVTNTADGLADQPVDAVTRWAEDQLGGLERLAHGET